MPYDLGPYSESAMPYSITFESFDPKEEQPLAPKGKIVNSVCACLSKENCISKGKLVLSYK